MTKQAEELNRALSALVSAVDLYQEHRRRKPADTVGLCRLGANVDRAANFVPPQVTSAVMTHLSDSQDVFVNLE